MKRNIIACFVASMLIMMTGCKKDFLEEKRDLTGVNEEVYKDPHMAQAYVNYIYRLFQPADNAIAMVQYQTNNNGGYSDNYTRTTDELPGRTGWSREWGSMA